MIDVRTVFKSLNTHASVRELETVECRQIHVSYVGYILYLMRDVCSVTVMIIIVVCGRGADYEDDNDNHDNNNYVIMIRI